MLQPARLALKPETHEELFLARYGRVRAWAMQLTENDHERAEDLVHDVYIQLVLQRPDLKLIGNLDGYLYRMLRNLHVSQVRRRVRGQYRTLSMIDYDSAEIGLRAADPRNLIRCQDELRQVCEYACTRKESSKAGSVLILRFLHGYYPREIALVMQNTRAAVEERLRLARSEARQYLENPGSLRFLRDTDRKRIKAAPMGFARPADEFLSELRSRVFSSCQGQCLTGEQLARLYDQGEPGRVEQQTLAHLVSCPACLDQVNRLLDLAVLAERFPTDTLGPDRPSKGGGDDDGPTGGASASELETRRCRNSAKEVLEHRPEELCISINGNLISEQRVSAGVNEQTLTLNLEEEIDFIEVHSEQQVRLLLLSVESKSTKAGIHTTEVNLSDDRTLVATLDFNERQPTVRVVYCEPAAIAQASEQEVPHEVRLVSAERGTLLGDARFAVRRLLDWLRPALKPTTITAVLSLLLIAVLLLVRLHVPTASAAELLHRSVMTEEALAGSLETALHRTITLTQSRAGESEPTTRYRIEIWQSASHALKLRRLYDEHNNLIAGEWTKPDGTSTVYHRGKNPEARTAPDLAAAAVLETGELWRLDGSAKEFQLLSGNDDAIKVDETSEAYILSYQRHTPASQSGLSSGTVTLNKADLHAVDQTLKLVRSGETREYRFTETEFENEPASSIAPGVFQPDPELLAASSPARVDSKQKEKPIPDAAALNTPVASAELEIEVTYLLNRIRANLGEQVSMSRTSEGVLRVEALAETDERKQEILRSLNPVIHNPAVRVEVSTVAEALDRQKQRKPGDTSVREVEVTNSRSQAEIELRAYYSARLVGREAIDEEINRYRSRVMTHSRQALLRASALRKLVNRFSPAEVRALAPEAQAKWLAMVREQASACRREVAALKQELGVVFKGSGEATGEAVNEANLSQAVERLVRLSYANDETVGAAFTVSAESRSSTALKSAEFWRSLSAAEKLAAAIQSVYQK